MGSTTDERLCGICSKELGKYKCGKCTMPFCSVPCSRTHRTQCIPIPKPAPTPQSPPPPAKPRRLQNPFTALDSSPELPLLFQRYPNLPSLLLSIDAAMQPPTLSQQVAAQAAAATAQANGRGGGPKNEKWNHDVSLRRGKKALHRARNLTGKDGEAVREYQALVLKLVGRNGGTAGFGGAQPQTGTGNMMNEEDEADVADLLRQQLAEEDARLIEELLRAEQALS